MGLQYAIRHIRTHREIWKFKYQSCNYSIPRITISTTFFSPPYWKQLWFEHVIMFRFHEYSIMVMMPLFCVVIFLGCLFTTNAMMSRPPTPDPPPPPPHVPPSAPPPPPILQDYPPTPDPPLPPPPVPPWAPAPPPVLQDTYARAMCVFRNVVEVLRKYLPKTKSAFRKPLIASLFRGIDGDDVSALTGLNANTCKAAMSPQYNFLDRCVVYCNMFD
jgi:hypothetical protein